MYHQLINLIYLERIVYLIGRSETIEYIPSGDAFVNVMAMVLLSIVFASPSVERFVKASPTVNKPLALRLAMPEAYE